MELLDQITALFSDFVNPKKRVFAGYLGLSVLIAFAWLMIFRGTSLTAALRRIFDPKVFFSRSAGADYKIFVINRIFSGFISPILLSQLTIAVGIYIAIMNTGLMPINAFSSVPTPIVITLFSLTMFIADDFTKYLMHRFMHRWPVLWSLHKVHHSAETLTPVTLYRVHPLEAVLGATRSTVTQASVIGLFYYLFGDTVSLYSVVGINVLIFVFHITGSNLRHSHIDIRYPAWVEHVFISPCQHQVHHSIAREHYDKNFGAALAIWDWLFGSLHLSETTKELTFGLAPSEGRNPTGLRSLYLTPFREIYEMSARRVHRLLGRAPRS